MSASSWKTRTATLTHALILALLGLVALMPALGLAQDTQYAWWQKAIKDAPPSGIGCFQASYPNTQWQPVTDRGGDYCTSHQSNSPRPMRIEAMPGPVVPAADQGDKTGLIDRYGYAATVDVQDGDPPISSAEGSFINITGVTGITNLLEGAPDADNTYSLQINTNLLNIPKGGICDNDQGCKGWVQYVYQNASPTDLWANHANIGIWYWLAGTVNSCPLNPNWPSDPCVFYVMQEMPQQPFTDFNDQINIFGQTANGEEIAIVIIGNVGYAVTSTSQFSELPQAWAEAQFNVFGMGSTSDALGQAFFNDGSSLTVNTSINNGTTNAPGCSSTESYTGESNNLYYNSPCCAYAGGKPSIVFVEGTPDTGITTQSCDSLLGDNTITPVVTPSGGGTISPSVPLHVPNSVVSTFTVTPSSGYKIASVTGCGGTLSGNTYYSTGPANGNCTVAAAFTSTALTYTVTASAGTGGTISPSGAVSVTGGSTRAFTVTPNSGYSISSVGGTCGGTLSGNTYTTNAITANCTVAAAFTSTAVGPTVTLTQITPSGTSSPAVGTAVSVSPNGSTTFTITPPAGANHASWAGWSGGCGAISLASTWNIGSSLILKVGPVTSNCTFPVAFTVTNPSPSTVTLTQVTPSGTSSPAVGTAVVSPNGSTTFAITPPAGANNAAWNWNGGCGTISLASTWYIGSSLALKVGPVTSNCTFTVTFTTVNPTVTLTRITPSGTANPAVGTAVLVSPNGSTTFTITPPAGVNRASWAGWSGGCGAISLVSTWNIGSSLVLKVGPVTSNCTFPVAFSSS